MQKEFPTLDQLAEFFGECPSDLIPDEGLSVYRVAAASVGLTVSVGEVGRSFQTNLYVSDVLVSSVVFEGLEELLLLGDKTGSFLRATFSVGNAEIKCVVRVRPDIRIEWSGISS
ncbi:MAG: hypothetical protein KKC55_17020 [Gammaproteobacteria bacterium]|jgi:hypothetical protein|nr:hypothetical protein [Gammaproteobacteria bacterium]